MAGKGGGAWKVAYADFATAMMAFFMVMWLISQDDKVKESIAEHFREPHPLSAHQKTKAGYDAGRSKMPKRPYHESAGDSTQDKSGEEGTLHGAQPESTRSSAMTTIYFDDDTDMIDENTQEQLKAFLPQVVGKRHRLEIRAHATRRPLASDSQFTTKWDVCFARCLAVMKFLEESGVPAEQMRLSLAGANEPASTAWSADAISKNARVEISLLSEYMSPGAALERSEEGLFETSLHSSGSGEQSTPDAPSVPVPAAHH